MKKLYTLSLFIVISVCGYAQKFYEPLDTNFVVKEVVIPGSPIHYDILCVAQDCVAFDNRINKTGSIRESFASPAYISSRTNSLSPETGILLLPHNISQNHSNLQDGGGATQMKLQRDNAGKWKVTQQTVSGKKVYFRDVNFQNGSSNVGGTVFSSTATATLNNTFLLAEDSVIISNEQLANKGFSPMDDYTILPNATIKGLESGKIVPRFEILNWITEIDANTAGAVKKHFLFGRAPFHSILPASSTKVFLIAGHQPSLLFRFDATEDFDYSSGVLSVYKQGATPSSEGQWIPLYDSYDEINDVVYYSLDSLKDIMNVALRKGATMFNNLGRICKYNDPVTTNDIIFISETGADYSAENFSDPSKIFKGQLAHHLKSLDRKDGEDNRIADPYGRILKLSGGEFTYLETLIEGGKGADGKLELTKPLDLSVTTFYSDDYETALNYLLITENIPGANVGNKTVNNETYTLSLQKENPDVNSLRRFSIGPEGASIHGWSSSTDKDFNTSFMTIQYPNPENKYPFNKSVLIAVANFQESLFEHYSDVDPDPEPSSVTEPHMNIASSNFNAWPNPVQRTVNLNKKTDIILFDANGVVLKKVNNTEVVDMFDVQPGMYFLQNKDKETIKLIVQ